MRTARRLKQKMMYSNQGEVHDAYKRDEQGNIVYLSYKAEDGSVIYYLDDDGNKIPEYDEGTEIDYSEPKELKGNISFSSNKEVEATEYGLSVSDFDAIILVDIGAYKDISETSLIWYGEEPKIDSEGKIDDKSATFKVVAIKPSINFKKIVVKKLTK